MPSDLTKGIARLHLSAALWTDRISTNVRMMLVVVVLSVGAGACSNASDPQVEDRPLSFPDAPGIVYLKSYGGKDDLESGFSFREFILGQDRYEATKRLRRPYSVAAEKDRIYVSDGREVDGYWILDLAQQDLKLVSDKALSGALGMTVDARGYKYLAVPGLVRAKAEGVLGSEDERGHIVAFDAANRRVGTVAIQGRPIDVAAGNGRLYVTDALNHRVVIVDPQELAVVGEFGKGGTGESEFSFPKGISVDPNGRVLVADTFNGRIKIFDAEGRFLSQYGNRAKVLGTFSNLSSVAGDGEGRIYAVDSGYFQKLLRDEMQVFLSENFYGPGEPVHSAETDPKERKNALWGWFVKPHAVQGGTAGMVRTLYSPISVAIDYENVEHFRQYERGNVKFEYLIWITSQFADSGKNLSVFAYTTEP